MINEERVKELYNVAMFDSDRERQNAQTGKYFRSDYIGRQMIISFFTGTIAFALLTVLYVFYDLDNVLKNINALDITGMAISVGWKYAIFMVVYLVITYITYYVRYTKQHRELVNYTGHLKKLNKLYVREDKLKKK